MLNGYIEQNRTIPTTDAKQRHWIPLLQLT